MKKISIFSILTIFVLNSCDGPFSHCMDGNNDVTSENRSITGFTEVVSEGEFDVIIVQDSVFSIIVEAEENLLPYISTTTSNSTLIIKTKNKRCIRPNSPVKIYVSAPEIQSIILDGSGSINAEQISTNNLYAKLRGSGDLLINANCTDFNCKLSGSGNIVLSGSVNDAEMLISGSGNIQAYSFQQNRSFATISGSGNTYLSVSTLLDVKISGSGSVNYIGFPSVNASITGSGSVNNSN